MDELATKMLIEMGHKIGIIGGKLRIEQWAGFVKNMEDLRKLIKAAEMLEELRKL